MHEPRTLRRSQAGPSSSWVSGTDRAASVLAPDPASGARSSGLWSGPSPTPQRPESRRVWAEARGPLAPAAVRVGHENFPGARSRFVHRAGTTRTSGPLSDLRPPSSGPKRVETIDEVVFYPYCVRNQKVTTAFV